MSAVQFCPWAPYKINRSQYEVGFFLFLDGVCNGDNCLAATGQGTEYAESDMVSGNTYYIVIDGYGGATKPYDINVQCNCD